MAGTSFPRIDRRGGLGALPVGLLVSAVLIAGAAAAWRVSVTHAPPTAVAPQASVVGASALVPSAGSVTLGEPPVPFSVHVVGYGETISGIATRAGLSSETVARNNGLATDGILHFDDGVFVPVADGLLYTVLEPGLTATSLAPRLGLQPVDLATVAEDPWGLSVGRTVLIPLTPERLSTAATKLDPQSRLDQMAVQRIARSAGGQLTLQAGGLSWPAAGSIVQLFSASHAGIDIAAPAGAPVWATSDGIVTFEGWTAYGGIAVCISDGAKFESCTYHAAATLVDVGARVHRGDPVAVVGMSGLAAGPHVHWELRRDGVLVNPLAY